MARWAEDGTPVPASLFEAAAFHRSLKAKCPDCGHQAVFHAAALWWLFHRKQWGGELKDVAKQLRCTGCRRRGVPIEIVRDAPTVLGLPLPDEHEWKRALSRFRC